MAICPIRIATRGVLIRTQATPGVGETGLGQADSINVTGVSVAHAATEVSRADVYTPSGAGLPALSAGRRLEFQITQELYRTQVIGSVAGWHHRALFAAGPFDIIPDALGVNGVRIRAAAGSCWGDDISPATVEIVEVGGNTYRAIDTVVTNLEITATPNQRIMLAWSLVGQFTDPPADSTKGPFTPSSIIPGLYREASILWGGASFMQICPAWTLGFGMTASEAETACVGGGNISLVDFTEPATLVFSGSYASKESIHPIWNAMLSNTSQNLELKTDDSYLEVRFTPAQMTDIAITEVNTYMGNDITLQNAGVWELEVDGLEAPVP